jgi:cytochrome P450/predicted NAD/FAD-dependent oxidoreductase
VHGDSAATWAPIEEAGLITAELEPPGELLFGLDGEQLAVPDLVPDGRPAPWTADDEIASLGLGDRPVGEALEAITDDESWRAVALEWLAQTWCADPADLSAEGIRRFKDGWRSGTGDFVLTHGYDRLADHLARGLTIVLETPVDTVRARPDGVEIRAGDEAWDASAAVITVPPPVLASGTIRFEPGLPARKDVAARGVGLGDALDVVATLREPAPRSAMALLTGDHGGFWRATEGSSVIAGWMKGPSAAAVRRAGLSGATVAALTAPVLHWMRPDLVGPDLLIADWGADPFTRGGYSYPRVGNLDASSVLAAPVGPTLFFAGEATAPDGHRGIVQGAIESGLRAAAEVAAAIGTTDGGPPPTPGRARTTYNPYLPEVHADPYPAYERMREEDPVNFADAAGMWFLVRHEDCARVLTDARFSAELGHEGRDPLRNVARSMLTTDDPDHARMRAPLARIFGGRAVERLRPAARAASEALLDRAAGGGDLDAIADFAEPLALGLLGDLLGVPADDRDAFRTLADAASAVLDPLAPPDVQEAGERATEELERYLSSLAARSRRAPRDDTVGTLVRACDEEGSLSWPEVLMACDLLVVGGYQPTAHLIGNALLALMQHPAELQRLARGDVPPATAIDELLRFDSPIQFASRIAREDMVVGGRTIRAGDRVLCLLGAANRDPAVFEDPARLDLGRHPNRHLGFGTGIHHCLGAALARVAAGEAVAAFARRFPDAELVEPPTWRPSVIPRGLDRIRTRTPPRSASLNCENTVR